jgi:hypothetical protein
MAAYSEAITFQGYILDPSGAPLASPSVIFKIRITAPNSTCLLYAEDFDIDMRSDRGTFNLVVGNGPRVDGGTKPFNELMAPNLVLGATGDCPSGYTRASGDSLMLHTAFDDGTAGEQSLNAIAIHPVPLAIDAIQVAGVSSQNALRLSDGPANPMTIANFNELIALINGNSSLYVKSAAAANSGGGDVSTASNVGTSGIGIFKQKTSSDLEFKKINAGSNKLTVVDDTIGNEVDLDINEANLSLNNLSGTVSVSKGGLGITSGASGGIPYFSGATTIASSSALTQFGLLYGGGTGSAPASTIAMTDGQIVVGKSGAAPQIVAMTGDATMSNSGVISVALSGSNTTTKILGSNPGANRLVISDSVSGATLDTLATNLTSVLISTPGSVPTWAPLANDTFAQYILMAGRSSGQTLAGGVAANETLTLDSTSHLTKGNIVLNPTSGKVGIGTTTPGATLEIAGEIRIGNTSLVCTVATEGAFRWNATNHTAEVCNGTSWAPLTAAACDNLPTYFPFSYQSSLATSTLATSNIVSITGLDVGCPVAVGVGGQGAPEYRVCSSANCVASVVQDWTSANNTLDMNGKYIQVRATSSSSVNATVAATVTIGLVTSEFTIKTIFDCSSGAIGTICDDGTVFAGTSMDGVIPMFTTRCDAGQNWDGTACINARLTLNWNSGSTNYVDTPLVNCGAVGDCDVSGETNTATLVATDSSTSGGFQIHAAAVYCSDLIADGQSDWYLPSASELNTLSLNYTAIGNFLASEYWSSSENSDVTRAFTQNLNTGSIVLPWKINFQYVRCVRK